MPELRALPVDGDEWASQPAGDTRGRARDTRSSSIGAIGERAKVPIERMLDFAKHHLPTFKGSGDA
jgi:hypothetical protein